MCKGKEAFTSVAFEITVDHFHRIHAATKSHYGTRNNKTIVRYDAHVINIHENKLYGDHTYTLYDENGSPYDNTGLYLVTNNGYHKWQCMMCPLKHSHDLNEIKWSVGL